MVTPLARMGDHFYFAVGNSDGRILEFNELTHTLQNPLGGPDVSFTGTVSNKAKLFRYRDEVDQVSLTAMYIPTSNGYTRFWDDFTTVETAPSDDSQPSVGLVVNEGRLWRLTTSGEVWSMLKHDDVWLYIATIPDGSVPRNIYRDYDDDNNRVVAVTTSSGLWLLDADNGIFWETDMTYPEHAYQGYGAVNWRADAYLSVGVGIHRKASGLITAVGLDKDDGLPSPFAGGFITDLEGSYNMMLAAVAGEVQGESAAPVSMSEAFGVTSGIPYPITGSGSATNFLGTNRMGAIFAWNGLGWSEMHSWNRPPTRVAVSMVKNASVSQTFQHMFFGDMDGGAFVVHIPSTYYNPIMSPNLPLERECELEESRIDWNTPDTPKIAKQFNIKPQHLWHQPLENGAIYRNRLQIICNWRDLNGIDHTSEDADILAGPGPYPFSDGVAALPYLDLTADGPEGNTRRSASIGWERYKNTNRLLATGLPHEAIWMTYRWRNDPADDLTSAVIEWRTIIARKWMRPTRIWTFRIDAGNAIKGLSETAVLDILDGICLKVGGVPLVIGDKFYIVDVTRLDGSNDAGLSAQGNRTVTCLEFTDITYERSI